MKRESGYYWVQLQFDVGLPRWMIALYDSAGDKWFLHGLDGKTPIKDMWFAVIDTNIIKRK